MSNFTRKEFLEAKALLKKYEGRVATVAEVMKRGESTIRKAKRSASYPKFIALNTARAEARKLAVKIEDSPITVAVESEAKNIVVRTRNTAEKVSKKLAIQTELETVKGELTRVKESLATTERTLKQQIGENIRLSKLLNKRPWWHKLTVRNSGASVADEN